MESLLGAKSNAGRRTASSSSGYAGDESPADGDSKDLLTGIRRATVDHQRTLARTFSKEDVEEVAAMPIAEIAEHLGRLSAEISLLHQALQVKTSGSRDCDGVANNHDDGISNETDGFNIKDNYLNRKKQACSAGSATPRRLTDILAAKISPAISMRPSMTQPEERNHYSSTESVGPLRLSRSANLQAKRNLQGQGASGSKWGVIGCLPPQTTHCHPATHSQEDSVLICGRGVKKPGAREQAMFWELKISEYTTLSWDEINLPIENASDCVDTFTDDGVVHVVLLSEETENDTHHQILSIWKRKIADARVLSPAHDELPPGDRKPTLQRGRRESIHLQNIKRKQQVRYEWTLVAKRKWLLHQFTIVYHNRQLIMAGGRSGAGRTNSVVVYSLESDAWHDWPPLPECVSGGVGIVWQDQLLLVGGQYGKGLGLPQRNILSLDLETTQSRMWYSSSYACLEEGGCGAIALSDHLLIVAGSKNSTHKPGREVSFLSDDGRFWYSLPKLVHSRSSPVLAAIGDCLLCLGGECGPSMRTSVEALDLTQFKDQPVDLASLASLAL